MTEKIRLYRFERVDDKRLDTLRNRQIFMSKPSSFNDLFDCQLRFDPFSEVLWSRDALVRAFDALYPEGNKVEADFPLTGKMVRLLRAAIRRDGQGIGGIMDKVWTAAELRDEVSESVIACCFFSTAPTDSLMWAHYADNHFGFCTVYEVEGEHVDLYDVEYSTALPVVTLTELLFSPRETMLRVLRTKSLEWAYEREMRILKWGQGIVPTGAAAGALVDMPDWLRPTQLILGARLKPGDARKEHVGKYEKLVSVAEQLNVQAMQMVREQEKLAPLPIR